MAGGLFLWRVGDARALNVRILFAFVPLADGEKLAGRNAVALMGGPFVLVVVGRFGGLDIPGGLDGLGGDGVQRLYSAFVSNWFSRAC